MADWIAGAITVPDGSSTVSVNLGYRPQFVMFMGTNFLAEDAVVTPAFDLGLFRGLACLNYLTGTMDEYAVAGSTAGSWLSTSKTSSVLMARDVGDAITLYEANCVFTATGFDVVFTTGAIGGYKVIYLAVAGFPNFVSLGEANFIDADVGFVAKSMLHATSINAAPFSTQSFNSITFGGGTYAPAYLGFSGSAMTFPGSNSQQYALDLQVSAASPLPIVGMGGNFLGPFLVTNWTYGGPITPPTTFEFHSTTGGYGNAAVWDGESWGQFATPSGIGGGQVVVSGWPIGPKALVCYTVGDEPADQGTGGRGGYGMSVVTDDFQWAVLIDGFHGYAVQTYQRGVIANVGAGGFVAADVTLTDDGFIMDTVEDDVAPGAVVWHGFGPPPSPWIPQMYRWQTAQSFARG